MRICYKLLIYPSPPHFAFGNKLLGNLEWFEQKYLLRDYQSLSQNTKYSNKNISALVPAMLAKSSINSWISMVKQAGITPKFIKKNFKNITDNLESSTSNYYNFHPLNSIIPFGTYTASGNDNKFIGELPAKLERALALVENDEQYPDIDLVLYREQSFLAGQHLLVLLFWGSSAL